jgi:hypothetical protein
MSTRSGKYGSTNDRFPKADWQEQPAALLPLPPRRLLVKQPSRLDPSALAMRSSIATVGEFSCRSIMPT